MTLEEQLEGLSAGRRALVARLLAERGLSRSAITASVALRHALRAHLDAQLPEHMRPKTLTLLPSIPLTRNGKVDVEALPAPDAGAARELVAPRSEEEHELLGLWQGLLGIKAISVEDDFFAIGGDSVKAVELAAKINEQFETKLSLALIFAAPTIAGLAEKVALLREMIGPEFREFDLEIPTVRLQDDVALDAAIRPASPLAAGAAQRGILLTGATGYFGAHLLGTLLRETSATIYCLVRAGSREHALERLQQSARKYGSDGISDPSRVVPVPGDLTRPRFGQSEPELAALSGAVDTVVHAAAVVNFAYPLESLRTTNVFGVQEIFRFAAGESLKPVHFISSIHVFSSTRLADGQLVLEGHALSEIPAVLGGYAQSRWIGEGIAELARARGIPVSIYRPSIIAGHSQTGVGNEADVLCRLFKGCIQLGCVPKLTARFNIVTADFASQGMVKLLREPSALGGTFHLVSRAPTEFADLVAGLRAYGYELREVSYREWHQRIEADGAENALYPLLPLLTHAGVSEAIGMRPPHFDDARAAALLEPHGLSCPAIDQSMMFRFLDAMVGAGTIRGPR